MGAGGFKINCGTEGPLSWEVNRGVGKRKLYDGETETMKHRPNPKGVL